MSETITVQNEQAFPVDSAKLIAAAQATLNHQNADAASEITIVITDDSAVAELNRTYRAVDSATDILSFPADMPTMPGEAPYLGDLIVAFPYAEQQAAVELLPIIESLMALIVHGTLHLLGFDHDTPENHREMWRMQDEIIATLGLPKTIVPSLENHS